MSITLCAAHLPQLSAIKQWHALAAIMLHADTYLYMLSVTAKMGTGSLNIANRDCTQHTKLFTLVSSAVTSLSTVHSKPQNLTSCELRAVRQSQAPANLYMALCNYQVKYKCVSL
eukprot:TRINITY_DN4435_c0_g2_i1.p2 TRINITY_DN4435_c0_g2~~TRINITY_DN4435_c0_g2_i1.p2  ORF type:complete len:115 (+),score=7.46 TRINITY_DN4435_c0_g2_i1:963-1307(+)